MGPDIVDNVIGVIIDIVDIVDNVIDVIIDIVDVIVFLLLIFLGPPKNPRSIDIVKDLTALDIGT